MVSSSNSSSPCAIRFLGRPTKKQCSSYDWYWVGSSNFIASINVVMFKNVVATISSSPYVVSSSTSSKLFYFWGDALYGTIVYISLGWVFASIA